MNARRARPTDTPWWVLWLAGHKKAVVGTVAAGLTALGTALVGGLQAAEVPGIFAAMLLVGGAVNQAVNTGPKANATEVPLDPEPAA